MFKRRSSVNSGMSHERQSSAPIGSISHSASASSSVSRRHGGATSSMSHRDRDRDRVGEGFALGPGEGTSLKEYRAGVAAAGRSGASAARQVGAKEVLSGTNKMVSTLVQRLVIKLPHSSGNPPSAIEADPIAQQIITSLIALALASRAHLAATLSSLLAALDPLVRQTSALGVDSAGMSSHALESEAILLKVVFACLSAEWDRPAAPAGESGRRSADAVQPWPDPPELEDSLAKQLLGTLLALTRQITYLVPLDEGPHAAPSAGGGGGGGKTWPLPGTFTTKGTVALKAVQGGMCAGGHSASTVPGISTMRYLFCSDSVPSVGLGYRSPPGRKLRLAAERDADPLYSEDAPTSHRHSLPASPTTSSMRSLPVPSAAAFRRIERYVGRIVFFLSSSNWSLVRSRVLGRLPGLSGQSGVDERERERERDRDVTELRILEWCNLDPGKLANVTQAFASTLQSLKPGHQAMLAQLTRAVVVNSITLYPAAYGEALRAGGSVDRSLEQLCDAMSVIQVGEASRSRMPPAWAWPCFSATLLLCPETMKKVVGEMSRSSTSNRKAQLLNSIIIDERTSLSSLLCQVDILAIASLLASGQATSIHALAEDIAADRGLGDALLSHVQRDDQLAIEGMASRARCLPADVAVRSVADLVQSKGEGAASRVGVRVCLLLVLDAQRNGNTRLIDQLYRNLSPLLRALFKSLCADLLNLTSAATSLLLSLIQLYRNDLSFLLRHCHPIGPARTGAEIIGRPHPKGLFDERYDTHDGADGLPHALEALAGLLAAPAEAGLRHEAAELMHHVWQCSLAAGYDAEEALQLKRAVAKTCPFVIGIAAKQVLQSFQAVKAYADDLVVLQVLMTTGSRVLQDVVQNCGPSSNDEWGSISARLAMAEAALLCSLSLPDIARPTRSIRALRSYVDLCQSLDSNQQAMILRDPSLPLRWQLYDKLVPSVEIVGPQVLQKFVKGVFRTYAVPCCLLLLVTKVFAERLRGLLERVIGSDDSPDPVASRGRFNVDGLSDLQAQELRNIGGMLASMSNVCTSAAVTCGDPSSLTRTWEDLGFSKALHFDDEPIAAVHEFIDQQSDLLVADSLFVRSAAQDALGMDLPAGHDEYLFQQFHDLIGHSVEPDGTIVGADPFDIFCLGALCVTEKRATDGLQASSALDNAVRRMIKYVASMPDGLLALRCKIKACQLVRLCTIRLPPHSLQYIVQWTDLARLDGREGRLSEEDRLQRDLNVACVHAFAAGSSRGPASIEAGDAQTETDIMNGLSWLVSVVGRGNMTADVKNSLICGVANICQQPNGLKRCIKLTRVTESDDLREVLTRALGKCVASGGAGSDRSGRLSLPFSELLVRFPSQILPAIATACLQDDFITGVLFRIFDAQGMSLELLDQLVRLEIESTDDVSGLFRTNSLCTRMFSMLVQHDSSIWLYFHFLLCSMFKDIAAGKEANVNFQCDEYDVSEEKNPRTVDLIMQVCNRMVDRLQKNTVPPHLRSILDIVAKRAAAKSPGAIGTALSGFVFLRLLCPAMAAPDRFGHSIAEDLVRPARWCSKIFNVISTGNTFKENLKAFNGLVIASQPKVAEYLLALPAASTDDPATIRLSSSHWSPDDQECDEIYWRTFATQNLEALVTSARMDNTITLLQELAQAVSSNPCSVKISQRNAENHMERLLLQRADRLQQTSNDVFFEGERCLNGRRVFYFIASNFDLENPDTIIAHVVQLLATTTDQQYDIIVDLCETDDVRMPDARLLAQLFAVLEVAHVGDLQTLALFSPSFSTGNVLRRIALVLPEKRRARVVATSSLAELSAIVNFTNSGLPARTIAAATLASPISVPDVLYHGPGQSVPWPCQISLGATSMTVQTRTKVELLPKITSCLVAVIRYDLLDANLDTRFLGPEKESVLALLSDLRTKRQGSLPLRTPIGSSDRDRAIASLLCLGFRGLLDSSPELLHSNMELLYSCETALRASAGKGGIQGHDASASPVGPQAALALIERCASAHPSLTLAFMQAWAADMAARDQTGASTAVLAVRPWIANLAHLEREAHSEALVSALRCLVNAMPARPSLLYDDNVWRPLVQLNSPNVLDAAGQLLMARARVEGSGAVVFPALSSALRFVMPVEAISRWASRLRKAISNTHISASAPSLQKHPNWREITAWVQVLAELLQRPRTADAQAHITFAVPDIAYSVIMLCGIGDANDKRSLCLLWRGLTSVITDASGFARDGQTAVAQLAAYELRQDGPGDTAAGRPPVDNQTICRPLIRFLAEAAYSNEIANIWFSRLTSLVASTCFQSNATTQGRAFAAFAILVEGNERAPQVEDDLVYQMLVAIRTALATYSGQHTLIISMIDCLASILPLLAPDSRYAGATVFWLAIAIIQVDHQPLFLPALRLIYGSLVEMDRQQYFAHGDFVDVMMAFKPQEGMDELDHGAGIAFDISLSFSLVALLFKGLRVEGSKAATVSVLQKCLDQIPQGHHALGLKMVLSALEATGSEVDALRTNVFVADLEHLDATDTLLAVACCVGMLGACESDMEKIWVCDCLVNLEVQRPGALGMWQETFSPRLATIINHTQNIALLDLAARLLAYMPVPDGSSLARSSSESSLGPAGSLVSWPSPGVAALQELGMDGLLELGFGEQNMERISRKAEWAAPLFAV